jgi:integrase
VAPKDAKTTVGQWCEEWLRNQATKRPQTARMAKVYVSKIKAEFGDRRLDSIRPSEIQAWLVKLKNQGLSDSYRYLLHSKFSQIYGDAIRDGLVARSPLSRHTSPGKGSQRPHVATTAQIWALHDALPEQYRAGLLLAAYAGLRVAEVCGLRVQDVDFMRGIVHPELQYPAEPLKTEAPRWPIPIPHDLALELSRHVEAFSGAWVLADETGQQLGTWEAGTGLQDGQGCRGRPTGGVPVP